MTLAETRKRRLCYFLLGLVLLLSGAVGIVIAGLKHLHTMRIAQNPIANLFNAIWGVPGIPFLWQHASIASPTNPSAGWSLYAWICIGLAFAGAVCWAAAGYHHHNIRQARREARVERLRREELGDTYAPGAKVTNVTNSTFQGSILGDVTGEHAQINYTSSNDLAAICTLVTDILTHLGELPLTPLRRVQFKTQLDAIRQECTSPVPHYTFLRKALGEVGHTLRHLTEAGTAHVLVSHWQQIWHTLQR